jgi:phosphomevalonate kinase
MSRKIIVLSGKQFSGKDTVADIIKEHFPDFKEIALAYAIKKEFGKLKNITISEIERNKPLYRPELIELGNQGRSQSPDFWIEKVLEEEGNIIVPDLRLKHELKTFKKYGAISIRVESSREERAKRGHLVSEEDPTETQLDKFKEWDYVVENNGTLESLKEQVARIVDSIEKDLFSRSK